MRPISAREPNFLISAAAILLAALAIIALASPPAIEAKEKTAKMLFGGKALPADLPARSIGFYSKGCLAGGVAIPVDGPHWQVMRLSRNRRWAHPELVKLLDRLSSRAARDGWNGLLIGDMSQPRGGPMLTGHLSHQIGLDADIWFTPMPDERLTYRQREEMSAYSVLAPGSLYVDDSRWSKAHENLLRDAAGFSQVQRILVHPGVKKKLCDTVKGDRSWLAKIRPYYGHDYHFHIRIRCQDGSPDCQTQNAVGTDIGCDKSLNWWFNTALKPKTGKPPAKKREIVMSDLPATCRGVLEAEDMPNDEAEMQFAMPGFSAPEVEIPKFSYAAALASKPIESEIPAPGVQGKIPIPTPRPAR
jgi:penicillin-insensitive murein DD-endopeptidase